MTVLKKIPDGTDLRRAAVRRKREWPEKNRLGRINRKWTHNRGPAGCVDQ